jgi:hypothetical protein
MANSSGRINPYDAPRSVIDSVGAQRDFRTSKIAAMLTRIVVIPAGNILGLLELFAAFGVSVGAVATMGAAGAVLVPVCLLGIMAFDIWWRTAQPEQALWARLLSPYAGGCFGLIPIWLLFPGFFVAVAIISLTNNPWITR